MTRSPRPHRPRKQLAATLWSATTELVGIMLEVQPLQTATLYPQYTIGLHAWLLEQVRLADPQLSAALHDDEAEKAFTLSGLIDPQNPQARSLTVQATQTYQWYITALSPAVVHWLSQWLQALPAELDLRGAPLKILGWTIAHPATTYEGLLQPVDALPATVALTFLSPTSFRRKKHHFPLPVPMNVFHSYLRRWNAFSGEEVDQEDFLSWIEETVIIVRHHLQSSKVAAGKKGSVTGFMGAIEFGLSRAVVQEPEYIALFYALGQLAPYCGTGHKTPFGLGQTRVGWVDAAMMVVPSTLQDILAQRIAELTEQFVALRKHTGGDRATLIAETWATVLARRELGESLQLIAEDLGIPYETAKTYGKLARRALKQAILDEV